MKQKDKAKAYDEVLTKAAALYKASEPMSGCNVILEILFPELKESEDEKILVIIKHCIECRYRETSAIQGISMEQCFAWLEKQGEKKPADSYCQENCKGFQETGKCFADGECKAKKEAKQKPVWKPSDEQMKHLRFYSEQNNYDGTILTSLYNDLKKLKKE